MQPALGNKMPKPINIIWRFFTSIRLALALIAIIIILSIIGIFITQAPQSIAVGSVDYQAWLDNVLRSEYGVWTDTIAAFGLCNIFRSPLFLGVGVLLMLNIFCCAANRWRNIKMAFQGSPAPTNQKQYQDSPVIYSTKSLVTTVALSVTGILLKRHYRVRTEEAKHSVFINADKYAFSRLGTIISHISLILLVLGFLLGSFLGFRIDSFIIAEGTVQPVGHDTNLALGLISYTTEYWPDGVPRDYRSEVVVYENDYPAESATIRVNHPLNYKGVRFYQSFFGPAAVIQVQTTSGDNITSGTVVLAGVMEAVPYQRPIGKLELPGTGLTAYLVGPAVNLPDLILKQDEIGIEIYEEGVDVPVNWMILAEGDTQEIQGLEFAYVQQSSFSGFSVNYEPGIWLVWMSFGLLFIGITLVLLLPYRQIQIMVQPVKAGSMVYLRASGRRGYDPKAEVNTLGEEIASALPGNIKKKDGEE
jgi:cytochrome c biogenesis protein